jgi:hypothetical protein
MRRSRWSGISFAQLFVTLMMVLGCVASASAQPLADQATSFRGEWAFIGGGGRSLGRGERAGREQALSAIQWGRVITREHAPGALKGQLEMLVEVTPLFVAFQAEQAEGAGFLPLILRWNLRERGRFHPFIELAGGVLATNREVPEGTTRLNFVSHAGAGVRVRIAERWRVMAGYRLQHLSNGATAARNPGFNSNVGYLGFAYREERD